MVAAVILLSPHRSRTQTTNRKHTGYQTWLQWPVNIHGKWIGIYIVPFNSIAALKALSTASPFHQVPYSHTVLLSSPKDFYLTLTHTQNSRVQYLAQGYSNTWTGGSIHQTSDWWTACSPTWATTIHSHRLQTSSYKHFCISSDMYVFVLAQDFPSLLASQKSFQIIKYASKRHVPYVCACYLMTLSHIWTLHSGPEPHRGQDHRSRHPARLPSNSATHVFIITLTC